MATFFQATRLCTQMHTQVGKIIKRVSECPKEVNILNCATFKRLCEVQLRACCVLTEREKNTPGRCSLYFILYRFISSSMCAYRQCSFFLPHSFHRHTNHEPRLRCVWLCQCNVPQVHIQSHHTCTVPLLLFPHSSCVKCRKNRYPLINSKAVKILSSPPKGCVVSLKEVSTQSLPSWNRKGWAFR